MKRTLIFMSALLMVSAVSAADVKSFGSSTDKTWTATSSDGCANGSTITLDGLVVTLGNSDDTGAWTWSEGNGGIYPAQMPSTDGTTNTLITNYSTSDPYDNLPTRGGYLVLKPSKSQTVIIRGKNGDNGKGYILAEVENGKTVAVNAQEAGVYHSYYVEADKIYYFFENAHDGQISSYRYTLISISVDPADFTNMITNHDFSANSFGSGANKSSEAPQGWTLTSNVWTTKTTTDGKGNGTIADGQNHWQIWNDYTPTNAKAYQKVGSLAPGIYTVGVTLVPDFNSGRVKLYGNNNSKAVVSGKYGQYTVDAAVTDGTLTLGLDIATTGTTDLEIDDFTLTYKQPLGNNYNGEVYLSELDTEAPTAIDNVNVTLGRTLTADQWNTLAVPFAITDISSLGTVKELKSADDNTLTFGDATTIEAGKPYIVKPSATLTNPTFNGVSITATEGTSEEAGDFKFVGRLFKSDLATDGTVAYFTSSGEVKKLTSGNINALRAYILQPTETSNVKAFFLGEETTAINSLKLQNRNHDVYDLSGRRVNAASMHNGIYIIDGKKYVVK